MHRRAAEGYRILICAPFGRDAESLATLLLRDGYQAQVHKEVDDLAGSIDESVGVLLLTEEALRRSGEALQAALSAQPPWSDVPVVLLVAQRTTAINAAETTRNRLWTLFPSAIVLERPLSRKSLLSALDAAMRSRQKQFEMRDRLSELESARAALAESEAQLRLATDAAEIGLWDVDPVLDRLYWPPRVKAMFGISADVEVSMADFYAGLHPDDKQNTIDAYLAACDPARRDIYDVEYRTVGKEDGRIRWVAAKGRALFDSNGRCIRVIGTALDITRRKAVELELVALNEKLEERVAERTARLMQTEAALRQSQKMEAVGQLTGGIAHDFNNMLTGIMGALDMLKRRLASGRLEGLDRYMDAATISAQRAATLTARLLAFSRRQSLDAKPLDVGKLIHALEDLLRGTLDETVELNIRTGKEAAFAIADANQLESAILNLTINARDAMPEGGRLSVETRIVDLDEKHPAWQPDITAGRYVEIVVSDTGVGMSPEIVEKAFDPFFTTKPIGQGTGLGLSMVYGFASQSGGLAHIESTVGVGSSVSIFLRLAAQAQDAEVVSVSLNVPAGEGQLVLVVEDDPSVRLLIHDVLEELSYEVMETAEPTSAISALRSKQPIGLMISDVGLPGLNGRQLAEIARQYRPDLPILFVTGYAENAAMRASFLGANMAMITKPFALDALGAKVSEMLKSSRRASPNLRAPKPRVTAPAQVAGSHRGDA